jgi:hypothetical protein
VRPAAFCNNCGQRLSKGDDCPTCGAASRVARDAPAETASLPVTSDCDRPTGSGERALLVIRGRNAGRRYLIDFRRYMIGRAADAAIFLDDVTVSRRHAEVFEDRSGGVWLRDLGSINGTYLNGRHIELEQLTNGDVLQVGIYKFVFEIVP